MTERILSAAARSSVESLRLIEREGLAAPGVVHRALGLMVQIRDPPAKIQ